MSLTHRDLDRLLSHVQSAAVAAGEVIEEVQASKTIGATSKADLSPVTVADERADTLLRERLTSLCKHAAWLSEESADDARRRGADLVWIVDPLDGTKEFIEGVPQYAISIALVEHGRPVLGVIHNPATRDMYSARSASGAYHNASRIRVRDGKTLLASRSETKRGEFADFSDWTIEEMGSIALKLARVSSGAGAATLSRGPKWEWDVCAGYLLVREAGGFIADIAGHDYTFNKPWPKVRGVVAGAPASYGRAMVRVREIGASDRMSELPPVSDSDDRQSSV